MDECKPLPSGGGGQGIGGERCPDTVLTAVMDFVDGSVVHVGDAAGAGGGLLGVTPEVVAPTPTGAVVAPTRSDSRGTGGFGGRAES